MVVCKIELWPGGDATKAKPIGEIEIINDGTGTLEECQYDVYLTHAGTFYGKDGYYKKGKCNYKRKLSPYHLIVNALNACGIFKS